MADKRDHKRYLEGTGTKVKIREVNHSTQTGLLRDESYKGIGAVFNSNNLDVGEGDEIEIKVEDRPWLRGQVRWTTKIDDVLTRVGIEILGNI